MSNPSVWNPGGVIVWPEPAPAPSPVPPLVVFALLQLDAYPLVDEKVLNTINAPNITGANIVASPVPGTALGAMKNLDPTLAVYQATTNAPFPLGDYPVSGTAATMEMFMRRDGPAGLALGSAGWQIRFTMSFSSIDYSEYASVNVEFYNNVADGGNAGVAMQISTTLEFVSLFRIGAFDPTEAVYEHAACIFSGDTISLCVAGVEIFSYTLATGTFPPGTNFDSASVRIQSNAASEDALTKYISGFRVCDGALYTAPFTPPVAPLTL